MKFQPFFDTLTFFGRGILYRAEHIARTHDTFRHLGHELPIGLIEDWYQNFEDRFWDESDGALFRLTFNGPTAPDITSRATEKFKTVDLTVLHDFQYPMTNSRYKWTNRTHWQQHEALMPQPHQDILAVNQEGYLIECSRFNVFVYNPFTDEMHTPPLESGCLDGVLRRHVLHKGFLYVAGLGEKKLSEAPVKLDSLQEQMLFVGNSVRGILPATYSGKKVDSES